VGACERAARGIGGEHPIVEKPTTPAIRPSTTMQR
jgi:hypothetical protein